MKKIFKFILFILIFGGLSYLITMYMNKNVETVSKEYSVAVYNYKPKVKIVDENSNTRPYAVSINNNHLSWPHAGLSKAYLCYELIAEGGITRILAFYKDVDVEKIGSVRSARHYFLDYALENDAIFVHYGHSPQALSDIKTLNVDNINGMYNTISFFRDKTLNKAFEHTAFTSTDKIKASVNKYKYRTTTDVKLLKYTPYKVLMNKDKTVIDAKNVMIKYSDYTSTKYEYDETNKVYKQYMKDTLQIDSITNKELTVKNIITYEVENTSLNDNKGRQDLLNIGSGEGYYITEGKAIKIKWSKSSRTSKTKYTDMNNNELVVNDGNTWIHIKPKGTKLIIN